MPRVMYEIFFCENRVVLHICFNFLGIFFACFNPCIFQTGGPDNLFVNYLSRIHREEVYLCFLKIKVQFVTDPIINEEVL